VAPSSRKNDSQICWIQKTHGGLDSDVWAVDSISLSSVTAPVLETHIQFDLNLQCDSDTAGNVNNRYIFNLLVLLNINPC